MSDEALAQVTTRLGEIAEDEGLKWTMDGQASRVAPAVLALEAKAADRASLIRLVQVMCLDPGLPEAKKRVSYRMVADAIRAAGAQTLAQGDPGLRWAQVVAMVALERVVDDVVECVDTFFGALRARSQMGAHLVGAVDQSRESEDRGPVWHELPARKSLKSQAIADLLVKADKLEINSQGNWNNAEVLAVFRTAVFPALKAINEHFTSDIEYLKGAIGAIATMIQRLDNHLIYSDRELQALWWGQSLYSRSRRCSYRDLSGPECLYTMAEDLLDVWGPAPDEALVAWYVETALRLDERSVAELDWHTLARGLPDSAYGSTPPALREDPTALPISTLLASERPRDAEAADTIWSSAGLEDMKGRALLRQLLRERQLARWVVQGGA